MNLEKFKIHTAYIISILVMIIIALASVKWGAIPALAQIFAFALTFASLILSGVAIIYALQSNFAFSKSMAKMELTTVSLSTAAGNIAQLSGELSAKAEAIPLTLQSMEGKMDDVGSQIAKLFPSPAVQPAVGGPIDSPNVDIVADELISRGWVTVEVAVYAFDLALSRGVDLELSILSNAIGVRGEEYWSGIYWTLQSVGLLEFNISKAVLSPTAMNSRLREGIKVEIRDLLQTDTAADSTPEFFISIIKKIAAAFPPGGPSN
jgi:hypothetical protein